jgi:hypothetical protein
VYAVVAGCDATAILYVDQVKWDSAYVLSSVPIKLGGEEGTNSAYSPMCRDVANDPAGVQFNLLFQGTQKKGDSADRDMSIKPGDFVDNKFIESAGVTPNLFELTLTCMEPYPDEDLYTCDGLKDANVPIQAIDFHSYYKPELDNKGTVALAILVDMSGSMKGLVHPTPPYAEDTFNSVSSELSGVDYGKNACDPGGARFAAVEALIRNMNDDDPVVVFAFSEEKFDMVCELEAAQDANLATKMRECFGTNRDLILGKSGGFSPLDSIKGDERGRTPLWYAVDVAYRYLQGDKTYWVNEDGKPLGNLPSALKNASYKHIVVVGDGPDTCGPSSDLNQCSKQCMSYNTSYETIRDYILTQEPADRIPVHFVQMECKGYAERDARQQEVSCLTGGQYSFINALDIPKANLQDALGKTLLRIRYTFRGYWRATVNLATMKKGNDPKVGFIYALEGIGKVLPGAASLLVSKDDLFAFKVGTIDVEGEESFVDRRVAVRKECDPAKDTCPADEKHNQCSTRKYWCDDQTLTCRSTLSWLENGDKSTCGAQTVVIRVQVETKTGTGTQTDTKSVEIAGVPTLCCKGDCAPPKPPKIPPEVAKPEGLAAACFFYDEGRGWARENPDDPTSKWVYWATLKVKSEVGCTWENLEPHLKYASVGDLAYPGDWECSGNNCFPPPGEGAVEPPVEEPVTEEPTE